MRPQDISFHDHQWSCFYYCRIFLEQRRGERYPLNSIYISQLFHKLGILKLNEEIKPLFCEIVKWTLLYFVKNFSNQRHYEDLIQKDMLEVCYGSLLKGISELAKYDILEGVITDEHRRILLVLINNIDFYYTTQLTQENGFSKKKVSILF